MNVLLVTMDQFRGDCLSVGGHPIVRTPCLDRLAAQALRLPRHYAQAAPCSPARASLYTGTYQMNNRVVGNGTPLDDRFDNIARVARRAGYVPIVFGYADQSTDPRLTTGPEDPRLWTYQGFPPGFEVGLDVDEDQAAWRAHLVDLGYDEITSGEEAMATEPERPAEHGQSAFVTDRLIEWLERQDGSWFAHASYSRPHPPYAAAGHWSTAYDPEDMPPPVPPPPRETPFCGNLAAFLPPSGEDGLRTLQAQYFGMISDVDSQMGRVWDKLVELGMWDDTLIVVTADHGEQLGDQGTIGKGGMFESSYHIPCIFHDPRHPEAHGSTVEIARRASTSCRPSARPSGSRSPRSATGSRSPRFSGVNSLRGGVTSRTGSTTGAGSGSCRAVCLAVGPSARIDAPGRLALGHDRLRATG